MKIDTTCLMLGMLRALDTVSVNSVIVSDGVILDYIIISVSEQLH